MRHLLKSIWYQPQLQDELRYHVQPYRYDSAIPTRFDVDFERLKKRRHLPGMQLDEPAYCALAAELGRYAGELEDVPVHDQGSSEFWYRNGSYGDADAASLYCMVRHFKPRRIIEVGCGFSSRVIGMAVRKNRAEGQATDCLFIEPYPAPYLLIDKLPGPLLEKKIEDVPLQTFKDLQTGDMLFIDTSHVIKTQNDCCYEYLEIIPSLQPGVLVHVHDIFTPFDYPEEWIVKNLFPFNEQYALECLLSNNPGLEIVLPVHLLWREHPGALRKFFPTPSEHPGAFWFRTRRSVAGAGSR